MSTITRSVRLEPAVSHAAIDLPRHQSWALLTAFSLSLTHTVQAQVVGLASPDFTLAMPTTWAFYVLGFTAAALARRADRRVQTGVVASLVVLLGVSIFVYPTTFTPEQQTPFAWFENDMYVALLVLALYLGVQRLRGRTH